TSRVWRSSWAPAFESRVAAPFLVCGALLLSLLSKSCTARGNDSWHRSGRTRGQKFGLIFEGARRVRAKSARFLTLAGNFLAIRLARPTPNARDDVLRVAASAPAA